MHPGANTIENNTHDNPAPTTDLISIIRGKEFESAIPELPNPGYVLHGVSNRPMGIVEIRESHEHPGYLDMTINNGSEIVSTKRPVQSGEFARGYLATMIAQEFPYGTKIEWSTQPIDSTTAPKQLTSKVYFIYSRDADMVKIGYSTSPKSRLESLQTGSPVRLELIGTIPGGQDVEMELHERFKSDRSHGEWFRMTSEIERFIRREARGR